MIRHRLGVIPVDAVARATPGFAYSPSRTPAAPRGGRARRGRGSRHWRCGGPCCSGGWTRRSGARGRRWESCTPGLASSWAAQATRVRSMTRLRLGAPPAPNWRERCSRLTSSRLARVGGPDGPLDLAHQHVPGRALQRLGEPEHARRVGQRAAALGGDRAPHHQVAHDRIVHAFDRHRRHRVAAAGQQQLAVVGPERRIGHDRDAGELAPQLGELGQERRRWGTGRRHPPAAARAAAGAPPACGRRRRPGRPWAACAGARAARPGSPAARRWRPRSALRLALRGRARPAGPDRHQGTDHLAGALEHARGRCRSSAISSASSSERHWQSVIPSSAWGDGSPSGLSNRKKWQYLWMWRPRKRKCQSMTRIGPCSTSCSSPVSSAVSRSAASAGDSPFSR